MCMLGKLLRRLTERKPIARIVVVHNGKTKVITLTERKGK